MHLRKQLKQFQKYLHAFSWESRHQEGWAWAVNSGQENEGAPCTVERLPFHLPEEGTPTGPYRGWTLRTSCSMEKSATERPFWWIPLFHRLGSQTSGGRVEQWLPKASGWLESFMGLELKFHRVAARLAEPLCLILLHCILKIVRNFHVNV